jgi:hypothetical protein
MASPTGREIGENAKEHLGGKEIHELPNKEDAHVETRETVAYGRSGIGICIALCAGHCSNHFSNTNRIFKFAVDK